MNSFNQNCVSTYLIMKKCCLRAFCFLCFNFYGFYCVPQNFEWAKGFGGSGMERAWDMAFTPQQKLLITGQFSDTLIADTLQIISKGSSDVFVCQLDKNGQLQWMQTFGGKSEDIGIAVATDNNGNVYVSGYFMDTLIIAGDTLVATAWDIFVIKYSADGVMQWCQHIKGESSEIGYGIAVDADDAVLVTGWYQNTINFNNNEILGNYGGSDILLFKISKDGTAIWAEHGGNNAVDYAYKTSVTSSNEVYVTGVASDKARFSGVYKSGDGVYVAKYNTNGLIQWVKSIDYAPATGVNDIASDDNGGACITGRMSGAAYFDSLILQSYNNTNDPYLAYCNSAGNWLWAASVDGSGNDKGRAITYKNGYFYNTGSFDGDLYIDDDTLHTAGSDDVIMMQWDTLGNLGWWLHAGGAQSDVSADIVADDSGNVYITGWFVGNSSFGSHTLTAQHGGDMNFFVAKANPNLLKIKPVVQHAHLPEITVFPNPAQEKIRISWSGIHFEGNSGILEITDISGFKFYTKKISILKDAEIELSIKNWKSGIYICTLQYEMKKIVTRFIISK